jgi:DNA processing protein
MEPTSRHFPRRNRVISGLAQGVVLIEAAIRSGSLITARYALEQGREAMACPGAPEDPRAGGCNQMIRDGAALIRNAGDVLEALAGPRTLDLAEPGREFLFYDDPFEDDYPGVDLDSTDDLGARDFEGDSCIDAALADQILRLLGPHPVDTDELARQCGAAPSEFSLAILELDLAGRIDLLPGGLISLCGPAA